MPRDGTAAADLLGEGRALDRASERGDGLPGTCVVHELVLGADDDDGEIDGAAWLPEGETPDFEPYGIYIGFWHTQPTWGYFRFTLSEPLTHVSSARLILEGDYATPDWDEKSDALLVGLEDSPDAPAVSNASAAPGGTEGRPLVGSLRWPASHGLTWRDGGPHGSVDLAPLLNQLTLQRNGLAKGAHLQLWLRGERTTGAAEVLTPARELDVRASARLRLCF